MRYIIPPTTCTNSSTRLSTITTDAADTAAGATAAANDATATTAAILCITPEYESAWTPSLVPLILIKLLLLLVL